LTTFLPCLPSQLVEDPHDERRDDTTTEAACVCAVERQRHLDEGRALSLDEDQVPDWNRSRRPRSIADRFSAKDLLPEAGDLSSGARL